MLAADAAQSAKPYDPMDIGVNRANFVIAAFNDVLMGSILPCRLVGLGTGEGNSGGLLIMYVARSVQLELQHMPVGPTTHLSQISKKTSGGKPRLTAAGSAVAYG
jgi:hypothetical protein